MSVQIKNVHPVSIPVRWSKLAFPVQRSFLIFIGILLTIGNNHTAIRIPDQTDGLPCRITGGFGIAVLVNVDSKVVFYITIQGTVFRRQMTPESRMGLSVFQIIVPFYPQIWKKRILP